MMRRLIHCCLNEVSNLDEKIKQLYEMRIASKKSSAIQKKLTEEITDFLIGQGLSEYMTAEGLTAKIVETMTESVDKKLLKEYPEIWAEVKSEKFGQRLLIV